MIATSDSFVRSPRWEWTRAALLILSAVVAFFLPSSAAGHILRSLTIVSLLVSCGLLGALAAQQGGLGHPGLVLTGVAIMGLLFLCTIVSPFTELSPGVVFVYLAPALLYALHLRETIAPRVLRGFFLALNGICLVLGLAIALDVGWADRFLVDVYSVHYPALVSNMVLLDKPVLSFGTHSMAGFMIYLLFFMNLLTYQRRRERLFLLAAILYVVLLLRLTSTTGTVYAVIAAVQLVLLPFRRVPQIVVPVLVIGSLAACAGVLAMPAAGTDLVDRARALVLGDRHRGLMSRYGDSGVLAGNFDFLGRHPLRPIGFGYSERLFYGDSGFVVNMLRGSIPLVVLMYGGLFAFLRQNVCSRYVATWICVVIMAFEVGFQPLLMARFVGFVPFMVAYFNSLEADPATPAADSGHA